MFLLDRVRSAWRKLAKLYLFFWDQENHICFYSPVQCWISHSELALLAFGLITLCFFASCTLVGDVQKDRAAELLGLHPCRFRPQHSSKLGNEFRLFTNYDPGMRLGGWEDKWKASWPSWPYSCEVKVTAKEKFSEHHIPSLDICCTLPTCISWQISAWKLLAVAV